MKTTLHIFSLLIFLSLGFTACSSDSANTANRSGNNSMNNSARNSSSSTVNSMSNGVATAVNSVSNAVTGRPTEEDFWNKAAEGGMAEVELSKIAQTKAQNAEVKKFAQMMVTDHTKANGELKSLAGKKNVTLPTELNSTHKSAMEKLNSLSGTDFDKAYVDAMVTDHDDAVNLFQVEADGGTDPELKAWAGKTLPTLKSHQQMIKGIKEKMK